MLDQKCCDHNWKQKRHFLYPRATMHHYECQTCGTQVQNINGPLKEIEEKIKQKQELENAP
jgi:DNA-directed RNA polymerase subunit RPC12/RpoP